MEIKLRIIQRLYRPNATAGSGSTTAAIRKEIGTGERVEGKVHSQKGQESIKVVQTAFDNKNTLVRQAPGQSKNNLL